MVRNEWKGMLIIGDDEHNISWSCGACWSWETVIGWWLGGNGGRKCPTSPAYVSTVPSVIKITDLLIIIIGSWESILSKLSKLYYVTANYSKPNCCSHCLEGSWVSTALGFAHGVSQFCLSAFLSCLPFCLSSSSFCLSACNWFSSFILLPSSALFFPSLHLILRVPLKTEINLFQVLRVRAGSWNVTTLTLCPSGTMVFDSEVRRIGITGSGAGRVEYSGSCSEGEFWGLNS